MSKPHRSRSRSRSHSHELLFESANGCVRVCRSCRAYELRFGNAIIRLSASDMEDFCDAIAGFDIDKPVAADPFDHTIIWVGDSEAGYRFRREEVSELNRLLASARLLSNFRADVAVSGVGVH